MEWYVGQRRAIVLLQHLRRCLVRREDATTAACLRICPTTVNCGKSKRNEGQRRTGPMSTSGVSSSTFSMADFRGSRGGGLIRVALGILNQLH